MNERSPRPSARKMISLLKIQECCLIIEEEGVGQQFRCRLGLSDW